MAGNSLSKGDLQRADGLIKDAEAHCSAFGFRCEMDAAAREELRRLLASVVSRRSREKPRASDGFCSLADSLIRSWMESCEGAGCEVAISRHAIWMLSGVFVSVLRLTDIDPYPGYATQIVGDLGTHWLCLEVPKGDPSLN